MTEYSTNLMLFLIDYFWQGNSSSEEAYLYCYTLCASDSACSCFSLSFIELSLSTAQSEASCRFGTSSACAATTKCESEHTVCTMYNRPGVVDNSAAIAAAETKAVATGAVVITGLILLLGLVGLCFALVVAGLIFVGLKLRKLTGDDMGYAAFDDGAIASIFHSTK
tara:strand:+ start:34 stop:534 length:501 start_codon:yes stop_codon:yes gene_type:complete